MSEPERPGGLWDTSSLFAAPSNPEPASTPASTPVSTPASTPASTLQEAVAPDDAPPPATALPPPAVALPPPVALPASAALPPPFAAPGRPGPAGGGGRRAIVLTVVAVLVGVGALVAIVIGRGGKPPAQAASITAGPVAVATTLPDYDTTTPPLTTPASPMDSIDIESAALAQLGQLSDQGLAGVSFNGQYAAQLASKYPGVTDPLQSTTGGSHTFAAADILAEFLALRDAHTSTAHPVILLKSTDYGKRQMYGTHLLWVTFAVGEFPDSQAVRSWCSAQFPQLSGQQQQDQCAVRRLEPGR